MRFDVIVIGGGHAGVEAAWAAASVLNGGRVALITMDPATIGVMSCNPAIGGLAKGQIVREVDALGGLMGRAIDATGIMFRMLNTSKGPAVRGPRAQADKKAYRDEIQRLIKSNESIEIICATVEDLLVCDGRVVGVRAGEDLLADAVVLTTGTFMRGLMHVGDDRQQGGRWEEGSAEGISDALRRLGFELGRLKTGTPPRISRSSLDWEAMPSQCGDAEPVPFSDLTDRTQFPAMPQIECRTTVTTAAAHDLIRANLHLAPMYSGAIDAQAGPRYCPSIEDKVVRFADRDAHHVFLEPETVGGDSIYCNGISTSLPRDVQVDLVRAMPGCERAEVLRFGYAVEYDVVRPHQVDATCMTKTVDGLFLAGQINGTSGYEEAAGQGVVAGLNAARHVCGDEPVRLGRDQAYIGVMLDDLVTSTPREPYRMFTSRAEHRLLLRADNTDERLTPLGRRFGLVGDARWDRWEQKRVALAAIRTSIGTGAILKAAKRPQTPVVDIANEIGADPSLTERVVTDIRYEGYVRRQQAEVRRQARSEHCSIPVSLDPLHIPGLRSEAIETLQQFRPVTIGQASRLAGITPADVTLLSIAIERGRVTKAAGGT
ncbi:MAG: tRNA uridine-5-carboxymethylaminomethyl(34) synthesis enzyme MnmG [Phycisphaerales bacterium]|nr:tRNA uridine-5-carboxymethylaminomethyl(34) synthesis enzyme MnmG [Phycisphaerales bacterium]